MVGDDVVKVRDTEAIQLSANSKIDEIRDRFSSNWLKETVPESSNSGLRTCTTANSTTCQFSKYDGSKFRPSSTLHPQSVRIP